jgi:hypothetical protein
MVDNFASPRWKDPDQDFLRYIFLEIQETRRAIDEGRRAVAESRSLLSLADRISSAQINLPRNGNNSG